MAVDIFSGITTLIFMSQVKLIMLRVYDSLLTPKTACLSVLGSCPLPVIK